jgi:hypothetical protein
MYVLHRAEADSAVFSFQLKAGAPLCAVSDARSAFFALDLSQHRPPAYGLPKRIALV